MTFTAADRVLRWWFEWGGIGGWGVFFVLAIVAIAYVMFDSQARRVSAVGWKLAAMLPALLILPTIIWRIASPESQLNMLGSLQWFFVLGVIGSIVPIAAAIGYAVNYVGYQAEPDYRPVAQSHEPRPRLEPEEPKPVRHPTPPRPKANAWLVEADTNRSHQLYTGDTRVGRSRERNNLAFLDKAVSREHFLIREEGGHFTVYDRGSSTGTFVNGTRASGPVLLAHGDNIEFGDTSVRFVTGQ